MVRKSMLNKKYFILPFLILGVVLSGCGTVEEAVTNPPSVSEEPASREFFAMDTYMTITAYGEHGQEAADAAAEEINRLDQLISIGNPDSEIYHVNASGSGELSAPVGYLVERSLALYESTGGLFDIAIFPVMEEWGFPTQEYRVPDETEILQTLPLTDASKIKYDVQSAQISFETEQMKIDLGGITKGYASAEVMEIFRRYGVESGLVSLGGNVQLCGSRTDGSPWRVAIQGALEDADYIGILSASDTAVITSGGYERYFEENGKTYHHIIDPRTGYPAESGLLSVTIVSEDGTLADALSTALFIMGRDEAINYWHQHEQEFDFILFDEKEEVTISEGIAGAFESEYPVHIIQRDQG